jgi:hypothetical protein
LAAKNNEVFHITPGSPDNRIKHLLKRPEITESVVIPITDSKGVRGVLNLHTQAGSARIKENIDHLRHLSNLISTAV